MTPLLENQKRAAVATMACNECRDGGITPRNPRWPVADHKGARSVRFGGGKMVRIGDLNHRSKKP